MPPRFDAHCHLPAAAELGGADRRVVCGTGAGDWDAVLALAHRDATVLPMLGLHPWWLTGAAPDWAQRLEARLRSCGAGVGECGLDFTRPGADRAAQEGTFRQQLRLAHALHRPVALHAVRAWGRLLAILREEGLPPAGTMVHDFSGSAETARTLQAMGVFLSFSGRLLQPGRPRLAAALRAVAEPWLLVETDGQMDLREVIRGAAVLRGCSEGHLAALTWDNGQRCFREVQA